MDALPAEPKVIELDATARENARLPVGSQVHQVMYGGLGGHASVATSFIDATPHLVHSITFYATAPPSEELVDFCRSHGVRWDSVVKRPGVDLPAMRSVYSSLRAANASVIIVHSSTALLSAWLASKASGKRALLVDHTPIEAKRPIEWLALAGGLRLLDRTVFLTPAAKHDSERRFGRRNVASRSTVISNGINIERFAPRPASDATSFTVSMLSRFTPLRDHRTLIDGVLLFLQSSPEFRKRLRVVLAGDGPTRSSIVDYIRELDVADVVTCPGTLTEDAVISLLQSSDVYIHSSNAETMSTAVMQAMACGLPVVATAITGMDHLIDHNRTGLLVPERSPTAIGDALGQLARSAQMRQSLGRSARAEAAKRFSALEMAKGYESLAADLIRTEQ